MTHYKDGRFIESISSIHSEFNYSEIMGAINSTTYRFQGSATYIAMWERALSAAEVAHLYDPQTRFDLLSQPRKTYFMPGAAAPPEPPTANRPRIQIIG
jgi:hypothetical protein